MTTESETKAEFRSATESKKAPKAVADSAAGMLLAFAEVSGTPDQTFRALTTNEVEKWWTIPGVYRLKDWKADLSAQGRWSVTVELHDGKQLNEWGEVCELDVPNKIVMTRRFGANPLLGERETTLTYRLEPSPAWDACDRSRRRVSSVDRKRRTGMPKIGRRFWATAGRLHRGQETKHYAKFLWAAEGLRGLARRLASEADLRAGRNESRVC